MKRDEEGSYKMVRKLAVGNREMRFRYMRMTPDRKERLLSLGAPLITICYQLIIKIPFPLSSGFRYFAPSC